MQDVERERARKKKENDNDDLFLFFTLSLFFSRFSVWKKKEIVDCKECSIRMREENRMEGKNDLSLMIIIRTSRFQRQLS